MITFMLFVYMATFNNYAVYVCINIWGCDMSENQAAEAVVAESGQAQVTPSGADKGADVNNGRTGVLVAYALYALSPFFLITYFFSIIITLVSRGSAHEMWKSHHQYQIRTFVISIAAIPILFLIAVAVFNDFKFMIYTTPILGAWVVIRSIKGGMRAFDRQPILKPKTFLI